MKLWIRIDAALRSDPNVAELANRLNITTPEAVGHCVLVWSAIAEHRPDGNLAGISSAALEDWAGYRKRRGKPAGAFAKVFREIFLSDHRVKGWHDRQGKLIEKAEKERARKFRGTSAEESRNSAPTERNGTEQTTASSRERVESFWPADYRPDLDQLLDLVLPTAARRESWLRSLLAMHEGMHPPARTPIQMAKALRAMLGNTDTPNWKYYEGCVRSEAEGRTLNLASRQIQTDDADFVEASELLQGLVARRDPLHSHTLTVEGWATVDEKQRQALKAIGGIDRVLTAKPAEWPWVVKDFIKAQRGAAA